MELDERAYYSTPGLSGHPRDGFIRDQHDWAKVPREPPVLPKLNHALDRFNQGCVFFERAVAAWKAGNFENYETSLRKAGTESVGALEWALKVYLRSVKRAELSSEEERLLVEPRFDQLVEIFLRHAVPTYPPDDVPRLHYIHDAYRNLPEHEGSVPDIGGLSEAIGTLRRIFTTYLSVRAEALRAISPVPQSNQELLALQTRYFEYVLEETRFLDLTGISPRVGGAALRIPLEDVFVDLAIRTLSTPGAVGELQLPEREDQADVADAGPFLKESSWILHERHERGEIVTVADLVSKRRVMILGDPGAGKSTLLRSIARSVIKGQLRLESGSRGVAVPIIIKAADYARHMETTGAISTYDYIRLKRTARFGPVFEAALREGRGLVMVDGLDEVRDPETRSVVVTKFEEFVREFPENCFVLTSRLVGYRQSPISSEFVLVTIAEMSSEQIMRFLDKWCSTVESQAPVGSGNPDSHLRAERLWQDILGNPGVRKLAGNILMLTIIAMIGFRGIQLPNRRADLYNVATETLIQSWPLRQRGIRFDLREVLEILSPIAFGILESHSGNDIPESELEPQVIDLISSLRGLPSSEARVAAREFIEQVQQHIGLFVERGGGLAGPRRFGFLHLTFAEYLAARHLAELWLAGRVRLSQFAHRSRWHEVVLLMAGYVGSFSVAKATDLVRELLSANSAYERLLHRDLLLVSDVLADNVRVHRPLLIETCSTVFTLAISTPQPTLWSRLAQRLELILRVSSVPEIQSMTTAQSDDTKKVIARKLVLKSYFAPLSIDEQALLLNLASHDSESMDYVGHLIDEVIPEVSDGPATLVVNSEDMISLQRVDMNLFSKLREGAPEMCLPGAFSDEKLRFENSKSAIAIVDVGALDQFPVEVLAGLLVDEETETTSQFLQLALSSNAAGFIRRLLRAAESESPLVQRITCLRALGAFVDGFDWDEMIDDSDQEPIKNALFRLATSPEVSLSAAAIGALAIIPRPEKTTQDLVKAALDERSDRFRLDVLDTIYNAPWGWGDSLTATLQSLSTSTNRDSSVLALRTLVRMGEPVPLSLNLAIERLASVRESTTSTTWGTHQFLADLFGLLAGAAEPIDGEATQLVLSTLQALNLDAKPRWVTEGLRYMVRGVPDRRSQFFISWMEQQLSSRSAPPAALTFMVGLAIDRLPPPRAIEILSEFTESGHPLLEALAWFELLKRQSQRLPSPEMMLEWLLSREWEMSSTDLIAALRRPSARRFREEIVEIALDRLKADPSSQEAFRAVQSLAPEA